MLSYLWSINETIYTCTSHRNGLWIAFYLCFSVSAHLTCILLQSRTSCHGSSDGVPSCKSHSSIFFLLGLSALKMLTALFHNKCFKTHTCTQAVQADRWAVGTLPATTGEQQRNGRSYVGEWWRCGRHTEINILKSSPSVYTCGPKCLRTVCKIHFGKNGQTKYRPGSPEDQKHGQKCENDR